ncbi:MAG: DNA polymerase/3'-5' exonuclease PolX [Planctomycetota bacterium]
MDNADIAAVFSEMAKLLEFRGENPFRIRAYENGAKAIAELDRSVAEIVADPGEDLAKTPGIGKTLVEKCEVLLQTGKLPQLEKLRREIKPIVIEMSRIPGLGAKKAIRLQNELGIESLTDLENACRDDRVAGLKGFGKKTQQTILDGMVIAKEASQRLYWSKADALAHAIARHMSNGNDANIAKMEWAGSYRRGRDTVGDLDLLVVAKDRDAAMDQLEAFPNRTQTILRGETKISIRVEPAFQIDMRCVEADEFGAALQYFTGSQAHNIHVRRVAGKLSLKVNEYGVFRTEDDSKVAGASEEEVYQTLGLAWVPPELREDRGEIQSASDDDLPNLITVGDMKGDLHMHTTATDGNHTIEEMAEAAIERGLQYIAITDHSQRVSMAFGLDEERLLEQWRQIDDLRPQLEDRIKIFKGIECDILEAGGMDLSDECLSQADWVLASVHYGQKQSREQITDRILGAIANPHVDCVAHPTGRILNRRPAYDVDMDAVMQACVEHQKCLELNANPARLDLNDLHLAKAIERDIPIVINTDAHHIDGLNVMRFGILQARRGGLGAKHVMNTRDLKAFESWLTS